MRAFLALLLLGALAAPTFAGDCDGGSRYRYRAHRHHHYRSVGHRRSIRHHRSVGHHRYHYRASSCRAVPHYGYRRACRPVYYSYYRPYLRLAPIYSRYGSVLTLDDAVFSREAADSGDADGIPQSREEPVGSRFLKPAR